MTITSPKFRLAAAGTVTALVAGALFAATGADSQASVHRSRVLRFGVQFSDPNAIDVPPLQTHPGDYRPGDYVTFGDVLIDRTGRRVGVEAGEGMITRVDSQGVQIFYSMAIHLRSGDVTAAGIGSPDPHKDLVVTGGSGSYLGARGTVRVVEGGDGTGTLRINLR
jgi:allene oxide cyclase-like protein